MLAMERAKLWATDPHFNEETQKAAKALMSSEQELLSAFGTELTFGTGGLRGVLGVGTNRMNEYTVGRATQGLSDSLRENGGKSVAIGYDSRCNGRPSGWACFRSQAHVGVPSRHRKRGPADRNLWPGNESLLNGNAEPRIRAACISNRCKTLFPRILQNGECLYKMHRRVVSAMRFREIVIKKIQVDMRVDEPRHERVPLAVDHLCIRERGYSRSCADFFNPFILNHNPR